jgi:hypothetical protein
MTEIELFQALKAPHTEEQETNWLCDAISDGMDIGEIREMLDFLEFSRATSSAISGQ